MFIANEPPSKGFRSARSEMGLTSVRFSESSRAPTERSGLLGEPYAINISPLWGEKRLCCSSRLNSRYINIPSS